MFFTKCTDREIKLLQKVVTKMEQCHRESHYDKLFHDIILHISQNKLMISMMNALSNVCCTLIDNIFSSATAETKKYNYQFTQRNSKLHHQSQ